MTDPQYWPPDIDRENLSYNDQQRTASTFHQQAKIGNKLADDASEISGSRPTTDFPKMPSGSPWSSDYAPAWRPEELLGFSVEEVPVCGEPHDVAKAAEILAAQSAPSSVSGDRMLGASGGDDGSSKTSSSPSIPQIRRRKVIV
jgi:hypothetical protein